MLASGKKTRPKSKERTMKKKVVKKIEKNTGAGPRLRSTVPLSAGTDPSRQLGGTRRHESAGRPNGRQMEGLRDVKPKPQQLEGRRNSTRERLQTAVAHRSRSEAKTAEGTTHKDTRSGGGGGQRKDVSVLDGQSEVPQGGGRHSQTLKP